MARRRLISVHSSRNLAQNIASYLFRDYIGKRERAEVETSYLTARHGVGARRGVRQAADGPTGYRPACLPPRPVSAKLRLCFSRCLSVSHLSQIRRRGKRKRTGEDFTQTDTVTLDFGTVRRRKDRFVLKFETRSGYNWLFGGIRIYSAGKWKPHKKSPRIKLNGVKLTRPVKADMPIKSKVWLV